jgi:hypothetical protein
MVTLGKPLRRQLLLDRVVLSSCNLHIQLLQLLLNTSYCQHLNFQSKNSSSSSSSSSRRGWAPAIAAVQPSPNLSSTRRTWQSLIG